MKDNPCSFQWYIIIKFDTPTVAVSGIEDLLPKKCSELFAARYTYNGFADIGFIKKSLSCLA